MVKLTKKQRQEWTDEMKKDYPHLQEWFIQNMLDIWECDPDWFKSKEKEIEKLKRKDKWPTFDTTVKQEYNDNIAIEENTLQSVVNVPNQDSSAPENVPVGAIVEGNC
jgi:hypothetical protein